MGIIPEKSKHIQIFGKKMHPAIYIATIFSFALFMAFFWPIIVGSHFIIPAIVGMIAYIPLSFFNSELEINNYKFLSIITYISIALATFLYMLFYWNSSIIFKISHYLIYLSFGYFFLRAFKK